MISAKEIGTPVATPVTAMNLAGAANAFTVFTLPALAGVLVGVKSAVLKKVILNNTTGANTKVHIGTGVAGAFVALIPALDSFNGLTDIYPDTDIPKAEAFADITAYPDAVGAGQVDISLEVLVRG